MLECNSEQTGQVFAFVELVFQWEGYNDVNKILCVACSIVFSTKGKYGREIYVLGIGLRFYLFYFLKTYIFLLEKRGHEREGPRDREREPQADYTLRAGLDVRLDLMTVRP